jgi:hypothetical protein
LRGQSGFKNQIERGCLLQNRTAWSNEELRMQNEETKAVTASILFLPDSFFIMPFRL